MSETERPSGFYWIERVDGELSAHHLGAGGRSPRRVVVVAIFTLLLVAFGVLVLVQALPSTPARLAS
jgi:hypothetical protein